ncbi:MAG: polysaccharide biosynthesis tyrosine autokinase [Chloroflexota bacterium]
MTLKLSDYLQILWRRKWIIMFAAVITLAVVAYRTQNLKRIYSASTTLRVLTASIGSPDFVQYDVTYADRLMNTYARIAQSQPVIEQLTEQLNLPSVPTITVNVIPQTELMEIVVDNQDPAQAQLIANTVAALLIKNIESSSEGSSQGATDILQAQLGEMQTELNKARSDYADQLKRYPVDDPQVVTLDQTVKLKEQIYGTLLDQYERARANDAIRSNSLSIVDPAGLPVSPSSPNVALNIGLGAVIGLMLGLGLAFSLENLDTTLHSSKEIEPILGLKTLARVPTIRGRMRSLTNTNSPQAEAYRTLRTNLLNLSSETPLHTLVVTSAEPGEGKSTTAAHLAIAIGQAGHSVVLVDCDLRRPKQHKIFSCSKQPGLSDLLSNKGELQNIIQEDRSLKISLITSGALSENQHPAELLASENMKKLLEKLKEDFEFVLLDLPAARVVVDATVMASIADGVVFVIGRNQIKEEEVREAYRQLVNVNANVVGIVINRAESNQGYRYYVRLPARALF